MARSALAALVLLAVLPPPARAGTESLPLVDEVAWPSFQAHCREALAGLVRLGAPLPAETVKAVNALLESGPKAQARAAGEIQKLLDAHCLVGVHINPESRVKAARGPRRAALVNDNASLVLVKVHNEAHITHALAVDSEQAIAAGKKDAARWVEATVLNGEPFSKTLSGRRLEYRVLRLTARQAGKREATLVFDAGQGTQDLGFRAEVPILFAVAR